MSLWKENTPAKCVEIVYVRAWVASNLLPVWLLAFIAGLIASARSRSRFIRQCWYAIKQEEETRHIRDRKARVLIIYRKSTRISLPETLVLV